MSQVGRGTSGILNSTITDTECPQLKNYSRWVLHVCHQHLDFLVAAGLHAAKSISGELGSCLLHALEMHLCMVVNHYVVYLSADTLYHLLMICKL